MGNNKIGVTYNTEKILESNEISYKDAFYIVKNDKPYDMQLNKNNYITYTYKGSYDKEPIYINNIMDFIKKIIIRVTAVCIFFIIILSYNIFCHSGRYNRISITAKRFFIIP